VKLSCLSAQLNLFITTAVALRAKTILQTTGLQRFTVI